MNLLTTLAGLILGAVFLASGASKLVGQEQWSRAAADFGAPRWLVPVLPWVELVLGALLIVGEGNVVVSLAVLLVLLGFTAAIAIRLAEGRHPECACFGAWSTAPLSLRHLVRNGAFIVLALLAML